jgi:aminotransferase
VSATPSSAWWNARVDSLSPSIIREMSGRKGPKTVDLTLGEPSLSPDPILLDRAIERFRQGPTGYSENAGLQSLRALIAEHAGLPGRMQPENVIATVGSEEAVFLALLALVDPGDEVLVPDPGYPAYPGIVRFAGAIPVSYAISTETGLVPSVDDLRARISPRTRVLVLNAPSNPMGTVPSAETVSGIVALAEAHGLVVISDEIYRDLVYDGVEVPSACALTERSVFISGLSKSCAATGLRLGYLVAHAGLVKKLTLLHQLAVTCAPRLSQLFAEEVFRQPAHLRAHLPHYQEARVALTEAQTHLPDNISLLLGQGAFYGVLDLGKVPHQGTLALALALLDEEDVALVPGIAFGGAGDWFFRLSYAGGVERVREGMTRIGRFFGRRL